MFLKHYNRVLPEKLLFDQQIFKISFEKYEKIKNKKTNKSQDAKVPKN